MKGLGPAIIDTLRPILEEVSNNSRLNKEELTNAIGNIQINVPKADVPQAQVDVKIPEIKVPAPQVTVTVPDFKVPEIKLPPFPKITVPRPQVTVNVPPIKIPDLRWPEEEMSIRGWVSLMGVSLNNPLPVQLRDAEGKPLSFLGGSTTINQGTGGPRMGKVTVNQLDIHSVGDGTQTTTAGVAKTLTTASTPCKRMHIMARTQNTDYVVVGTDTVVAAQETRRGIPLSAGQAITLQIDDVRKILIDSVVSGEGVTYLYEN